MAKPGDAPSSAKSAMLGAWEAASFPTWTFWGRTTVDVQNTGDVGVTVSFQAGAAAPAFVYIDPGENHREFGYWAGFPITVTDATQRDVANNQNPKIEVWVW